MINNNELYDFEEMENKSKSENIVETEDFMEKSILPEDIPQTFPSKFLFQMVISFFVVVLMFLITQSNDRWAHWTRERLHVALNFTAEETFGVIANNRLVKTLIQNGRNLIKLEEITKQFTSYTPGLEEKSIFLGWVWPVKGQITRRFGWDSRFEGGIKEFNPGIEMMVPSGSRVLAVAAGQVAETGRGNENDWYIMIEHGNGWNSIYRNLGEVYVNVGQQVQTGEEIAGIGIKGETLRESKFEFELKKNNQLVDPLAVLANN